MKIRFQDKKEAAAWAKAVGSLIVTFSAVEYASIQSVAALAGEKKVLLRDIAIGMPFAKRVELILRMIQDSDWPDAKKVHAIGLWNQAKKLSEVRNKFAHNPWVTVIKNGIEMRGALPVKKMLGKGPYKLEPLEREDAERAAIALNNLAIALSTLLAGPEQNDC